APFEVEQIGSALDEQRIAGRADRLASRITGVPPRVGCAPPLGDLAICFCDQFGIFEQRAMCCGDFSGRRSSASQRTGNRFERLREPLPFLREAGSLAWY